MMIVYVGLKYSTLWIDLNWKIDLSRKHFVCMIMWFEFLPSWGGEPRVLEVTGAWDAAVSSEQEDQHQRGQERGVIPGRWWVNVTDTAVRNCCSTPVVTAPAQETNTHTHTRLLPHTQIFHGVKKTSSLVITSGMGITTLTAARILKGQLQNQTGEETVMTMDTFPNVGLAKVRNQQTCW